MEKKDTKIVEIDRVTPEAVATSTEGADVEIVRSLPVISAAHTSAALTAMKVEQVRIETENAAPKDGPLLLELRENILAKLYMITTLLQPKFTK